MYVCVLHTAAGNTEELSHQITQRVTILLCKPADLHTAISQPAQAHWHEVHMSADHFIHDDVRIQPILLPLLQCEASEWCAE